MNPEETKGKNDRLRFDGRMKWVYTFVLLLVTIGWAVFSVCVIQDAMQDPNDINVLEASGASILLGSLIPLNVNVSQYWFRKKSPDEDVPPNGNGNG